MRHPPVREYDLLSGIPDLNRLQGNACIDCGTPRGAAQLVRNGSARIVSGDTHSDWDVFRCKNGCGRHR
ncbi:hypothetical protein [Streptomyces sp. Ac-502]|uniref:hypothetical protein n=1 Tax=Streptomyces sp. Ac-502 TaxID=3342801 RepID=UPI003862CDDC